ncbi:MAG: hypothetical protein J1F24_03225 [Oscillospiraceae bacterium]|nr:hypothetical protein [Oscillospiraceae bacterium]
MAKKVKTPEEVRAAMEKKTAKRTLFFGTFRKAFALFLAIAFTFALVQIAFTKNVGGVAVATGGSTGGTVSGGTVSGGSTGGSTDSSGQGENQTEAPAPDLAGDEPTVAEGETVKDKEGNDVVGLSKGDAVKLLNDATAAAAKAGYDWERKCYYTDGGAIKVTTNGGKDATSTLNSAIQTVDKNSSIDKVVGNFLDITGKDNPKAAKKAKGSNAAPEGMKDKFLLKSMSLTEGDIAKVEQDGNVYKFQLNSCSNPQKDEKNALHHATNDFITHDEVSEDVSNAISIIKVESTDVQYTNIVIVAEIADGKLTNLTINYLMTVKSLKLKVTLASVIGTGQGQVEEVYKNFAY